MKKEKKKRLRRLSERKDRRYADVPADCSGRLTVNQAGYGFVSVEPSAGTPKTDVSNVFIPPQFLGGAMDGDTVGVRILPDRPDYPRNDRGPAGRVVAILSHARETLVGEVLDGRTVRPLGRKLPDEIEIAGKLHGARRGDWVKLRLLLEENDGRNAPRGTVLETIGAAGTVKGDLDAIAAEYDLAPAYTPEEDQAAARLEPRAMPREDLRERFTLTIDPVDAKDFDDAVSLAPGRQPEWLEVGVHIADVAALIAPRSQFDREAARRGFTAYLPGRTLPMIPKTLTAKMSLHVGDDCPAHTILFQVERATGRIVESRRCHSLLRVNRRLNYDEVQQLLDGNPPPADWTPQLVEAVRSLAEITGRMRKLRRKEEEFIDLALPEIRVLCDEGADRVSGLSRKIQRSSEFLVEECMLAANSAVGAELQERGVAGLYRVHPEPEPDKLEDFISNVEETFGLRPGNLANRHECRKFLESLPDDPCKPIILSLFLRSLPRASYLEKPQLHYGLGKQCYCHFTSPIRRYPDLTVHQQLWNFDLKQRTRSAATLARLALECSAKEENNDNAYFAASDRLKLRYLAEQLATGAENYYEAVVARVVTGGLLADIPELGIYGFVPRESLERDAERRRRRGETAEAVRCGDRLYLRLAQIDPLRGSAEFVPARREAR